MPFVNRRGRMHSRILSTLRFGFPCCHWAVAFLLSAGLLLSGLVPVCAQPTFSNSVLPNGVPSGASGSGIVEGDPLFFDPASGDYRPDKPAGSPLVDLAGSDTPFEGRLLNGQTQTEGGWDAGALESNGSALPVDLTDLSATLSGEAVRLSWTTASEMNNAGFRVQRREGKTAPWSTLEFVEGTGTTTQPQSYRFVDESPPFAAGPLQYRLVQVDVGGALSPSDPVVLERPAPDRLEVRPPSPNPAHSETTVQIALPDASDARGATGARLSVFDVLGRQVTSRSLETEGGYRRSVRLDVSGWPSGLYFVRLKAGSTVRTERLSVVR